MGVKGLKIHPFNPLTPKSDLIDFTLCKARRVYLAKGDPLGVKGLNREGKSAVCLKQFQGNRGALHLFTKGYIGSHPRPLGVVPFNVDCNN